MMVEHAQGAHIAPTDERVAVGATDVGYRVHPGDEDARRRRADLDVNTEGPVRMSLAPSRTQRAYTSLAR